MIFNIAYVPFEKTRHKGKLKSFFSWGSSSVVAHLAQIHEVLGSIPSSTEIKGFLQYKEWIKSENIK